MSRTNEEKSYIHALEAEDHRYKDSKSTKDKPKTPYKKDRSKVIYESDSYDDDDII